MRTRKPGWFIGTNTSLERKLDRIQTSPAGWIQRDLSSCGLALACREGNDFSTNARHDRAAGSFSCLVFKLKGVSSGSMSLSAPLWLRATTSQVLFKQSKTAIETKSARLFKARQKLSLGLAQRGKAWFVRGHSLRTEVENVTLFARLGCHRLTNKIEQTCFCQYNTNNITLIMHF